MVRESASALTGGAVADLEVRGIAKRFGSVVAIERVDIEVQRGEFVAVMGPSGCGKTTLLRIIAGLERADAGSLLLRGDDISDVPVHKRSTRLIWQDYSLFPFLNVRKNIEFGLTLKRHDKKAVRQQSRGRGSAGSPGPFALAPHRPVERRREAAGRHRPGAGHRAGDSPPRRAA